MKVRRYVARDMRTALHQVRAEQGPDVVILSNRTVDGGIELVTAEQYDESLLSTFSPKISYSAAEQSRTDTGRRTPPRQAAAKKPEADRGGPALVWTQQPLLEQMRGEIRSLRQLLEQQLSGLAWGEVGRRHPLRASILRRLTRLGLSPRLARSISDELPEDLDDRGAWPRALALLSRRLPISTDSILIRGGVIALVGPTGVGKTTLIAKLAVRFSLAHGNDRVALVTTDNRRIGAFEQLKSFGGIAGLPVWTVGGAEELRAVLDRVRDKDLVLIDTAGIGCRDPHLAEHLEIVQACTISMNSYLVMSAATQAEALETIVETYAAIHPSGCMITKLDETSSLGAALSMAIQHDLPIVYTSSGQRIPEDVDEARAHSLVSRAVALMRHDSQMDDEVFMEALFDGDRVRAAG